MNKRIERRSWYFTSFLVLCVLLIKNFGMTTWTANTLKYAELAAGDAMPVYVELTVAKGEQFEGANVASKKRGRSVQLSA